MAEKKEKKAEVKTEEVAKVSKVETSGGSVNREQKKSRWTLESCKGVAKRFGTPGDWQSGAPSSYKAASAKGWLPECCTHMSASKLPAGKSQSKSKAPTGSGFRKSA